MYNQANMTATADKHMPQASIHKDIRFLIDDEQLRKATSKQAFEDGLACFNQDRVIEHYSEQGLLYGTVESEQHDGSYSLSILAGPKGQLSSDCECTNKSDMLCKHAVAALLAYNAPPEEEGLHGTAKDTAVKDRIKRGQTEVTVNHIEGQPDFGTWQAQSFVSTTGRKMKYRVEIRSVHERINYCTCPDLANNQLGTCKHIEAVLHQLNQSPGKKTDAVQPLPFVYKSYGEDGGIWIQRTGSLSEENAVIIDKYFDPSGRFSGQMPEDFFKFTDAVFGLDSVVICDDAKQYAARMLDKKLQQAKAEQVRSQILLSKGHLPGIDAKLYPYQLEGVAFLAANGRALLADDMGLGKTLQSIAAAAYLIQNAQVRRILVVCPASLKHQWAREIGRFSAFESQVIDGSSAKRKLQYRKDKTFFVVNYELATRDLEAINEQLKPDLLILDEAQRIKNWRTKVASAIKAIHSQYAFVLTGTPLENKLEELYSLMQVVDQDILGPLWRYLNDYHILDDKDKILGYQNLTELRERIRHVMLRRNRTIVSDQLPGRTTVQLDVPMSNKQRTLHDNAMTTAAQYAAIARKRALTPAERNCLMAALQQARMACDAAGLVDKQSTGSAKLNELKSLIEQVCIDGGNKMVVFSQWKMMTDMVEQMLKTIGIGYCHLHGRVPAEKRAKMMERFASDELCQVFVSTDAGGSGLNLQSASVLVNLDIPWNPAVLEQRNARVHRLGQSNKVQIFLMIAEDSYEQRVFELVNNKQALFDNVIDPEGTEDVIGVGKKALSQVLESLPQQDISPASPLPDTTEASSEPVLSLPTSLQVENLEALIAQLQQIRQYFAERIEQVLAKGGGLLLVLSAKDNADQQFIDSLNVPLPIAMIDVITLRQLQQLGVNLLDGDAEKITLPQLSPEQRESHWHSQAREKLQAATALIGKQVNTSIVDLLCTAVAALMSEKAGLDTLMPLDDIPVWLFGTAVPKALLTVEQANIISRVIGLRQANLVPDGLIDSACEDTQKLMAQILDAH